MEEGQDIYARIDQYLLNQMKPEEKSAFEQELNQNPDLRNKVKIQGLIIEEIKRREDFFLIIKDQVKTDDPELDVKEVETKTLSVQHSIPSASINEFEKKKESVKADTVLAAGKSLQEIDITVLPKDQKIFPWKTMLVAAMLIGISIIVFWQPTKYSNKVILDTYAYNYANESLFIAQNWDEETRSVISYNIIFSPREILILDSARYLYKNQNFKSAADKFEKVNNLIEKNSELSMLMAFSQLKSGLYDKAYTNYSKLTQNSDIPIFQEAKYYLALTLIGRDDNKSARKLLKDIVKSDGEYSNDAKKILAKMRWF